MDWKNNPEEFHFKISDNASVQAIKISKVKEFGIGDLVKFERHTVMIEGKLGDPLSELSHERLPQLTQATLFLKVILEGSATLYQYEAGNIRRFFYHVAAHGPVVQPLLFKRYKVTNSAVGTNYQFRQQLLNDLKCAGHSGVSTARLEYKLDPLMKYFQEYNSCVGGEEVTYVNKQGKGGFHISAHIGFNHGQAFITQDPSEPFPGP